MEDETYNEVWQVWQKEKQSARLQQIPKNFYSEVLKYIFSVKGDSDTASSTRENTKRLLNNIYERRKQKLVLYSAYGQPLPQSIPKQEELFYGRLITVIREEKLQHDREENRLVVIQDIPRIVLPSGNEIGPLERDKQVEVNDETDRNFLVNNEICRQ